MRRALTLSVAALVLAAASGAPRSSVPPAKQSPSTALHSWTKRLWRQHVEDKWSHGRNKLPPTGALYVGQMKLPILGQQTFMLRIVSRTKAKITLHGAMNLDEYGKYVVDGYLDAGSVSLLVDFNAPTRALLNRYKTRIRHVKYFPDDDYAELTIAPLILPAFRVRLHRTR